MTPRPIYRAEIPRERIGNEAGLPFSRNRRGQIEATLFNVVMALCQPGWLGMAFCHAAEAYGFQLTLRIQDKPLFEVFDEADYHRARFQFESKGCAPVRHQLIVDAMCLCVDKCLIPTRNLSLRHRGR